MFEIQIPATEQVSTSDLPNFWEGESGGWVPAIRYNAGYETLKVSVWCPGEAIAAPTDIGGLAEFVQQVRARRKAHRVYPSDTVPEPTHDWDGGVYPSAKY